MQLLATATALPSLPLAAVSTVVVLLIDLAIAFSFIQDLYQPGRQVAGGNKTVWLVVILFGSVLGWMAYVLIGRQR